MVNIIRGEIQAEFSDKTYTLCLTLGALAWLENELDCNSLQDLLNYFASGTVNAEHIICIITAGIIGGGETITKQEVAALKCADGASGYITVATRLLEATFGQNA